MTPEQYEHLHNSIRNTIKDVVNGKIDRMDTKIDNYIKEDLTYNIRMEEETAKWRKNADEKLELVSDMKSFTKVVLWLLGVLIVGGGAYQVILMFIK